MERVQEEIDKVFQDIERIIMEHKLAATAMIVCASAKMFTIDFQGEVGTEENTVTKIETCKETN